MLLDLNAFSTAKEMVLQGAFGWFVTDNTAGVVDTLLIFTTVLLFVKFMMSYEENIKLPPGPRGIPLLGHAMNFIGKSPLTTLEKYRKQYGDIYRLRIGNWRVVVVNGRDAIKTALQHSGDAFSDRPDILTVTAVSNMEGVAFCHFDPRFVLHRKIAASALKKFSGGGNTVFIELMENEAEQLVDDMLSHKGKPFDPHDLLYFAAANIIYQISFGKGKDVRNDEKFSWIVRNTMKFNNFVVALNPLNAMSWLRFIWPEKLIIKNQFNKYSNYFLGAILQKQAEIIETYDERETRHMMDSLISKAGQYTNEEKAAAHLTDKQIYLTVGDFIGAGFDTTATTLKWGMMLLAINPEVQEKVQKELDEVVGLSRAPSILDRQQLHYSEAMVLEILRMASTIPLNLPHSTLTDTELFGYTIPKNTIVLFNLMSSNLDPKFWTSLCEFRPERFLDRSGKIDREEADNVLTFGAGRRRCIGEQLARANLFVFLTSVLQRCKIIKPEEESYDFEGKLTLIYVPNSFKIKVVERSQ